MCVFLSVSYVFVYCSVLDPQTHAAKKRRVIARENRSFLLECNVDIICKVYSFLNLKDGLIVRRTCRALNAGTDAFQHCQLAYYLRARGAIDEPPNMLGFASSRKMFDQYEMKQLKTICNFNHNGNLRAILRNESLNHCTWVGSEFVECLIAYSKTDNAEAVTILLEDGRVQVGECLLDYALRKDFVAMAAALQENDVIKAGIQMCSTCSINIGCYYCHNGLQCCKSSDDPNVCRACFLAANTRCAECQSHLCAECFAQGSAKNKYAVYCEECLDVYQYLDPEPHYYDFYYEF